MVRLWGVEDVWRTIGENLKNVKFGLTYFIELEIKPRKYIARDLDLESQVQLKATICEG